MNFISSHKDTAGETGVRWGVEPMYRVLNEHGAPIVASKYYDAAARLQRRSGSGSEGMSSRDEVLKREITRVGDKNFRVYGVRRCGCSSTARACR
ncbi:hypothetical protein [Streptomyces sp. 900105245]